MTFTRRTFAGSLVAAAQDTTFRTDVKLVRMLATVKDANGGLVGGLSKEDFQITDNGAPQQVAFFERQTAQPLSVAILLDTSGSTAKEIKYELESLQRFSKSLFGSGNPGDTAALYTFNHDVVKRSNFTRRQNRIEDGMRGIKAEAGTSLYDAIYLGARDVGKRDGRRVIILITDGGDTTSRIDFHAALEAAHSNDAVIYAIVVVPVLSDAGRNTGGEHALVQFAGGTGGRIFYPTVGDSLNKAFDDILRELRTQYYIAYYPVNVPLTRNRFHSVKVSVNRPGLHVQTRSGYYGDSVP